MSLSIGSVVLSSPVLLAPMSGVSDLPFRRVVKSCGAGLVMSEMIASQAMIRENRKTMKMATNCAEEFPMAVQLAGHDPDMMAEAARLNEDRGAAVIDINMGCPVKKIVNKLAGSALMREEALAARIIEATVKAVSVPVTLKMRMGWDHDSLNAPSLARIAEECGVKMITVHGRTRCQMYTGRADWSFIRTVKEAVSVPVIGNGDVRTVDDAAELIRLSRADGVMIGRGAMGRPWFLAQVIAFLESGIRLSDPSVAQRHDLSRRHVGHMIEHFGEHRGVRMARKHLAWYSHGLSDATSFRDRVNGIDGADALFAEIDGFFGACAGEPVATALDSHPAFAVQEAA